MSKFNNAKRFIVCALSVCLALSISACGQLDSNKTTAKVSLDPKNPVTISIWNYYNGAQKTAFDSLVAEFNETEGKKQGIVVETFGEGSIDDLTSKVLDAAQKKVGAEEIPDVFAAYADTAYEIDQMGLVAELNPYLTKKEIDAIPEAYWNEGILGDSDAYKIFPIAKSTEIFMLNATDWKKFADATGATKDELATMEGVVRTAEEYYKWTDEQTPDTPNDGKAFWGRDALANYMIIGYKQLGIEVFDVENGKVTLNLDKDASRKLWDNYYVPFINGYFATGGKFRSDDIKTGEIISLVCSTSGAAYFPDEVMVNDIESYPIVPEVLPLPVFEDAENVNVQQGAGMIVSKSTPEKEFASVSFLKWFTQPDRNLDFSLASGYLPVMKEAVNTESLNSAFERVGKETIPTPLQVSLPVAFDAVANYEFYTTSAFDNGSSARYAIQDAIAIQSEQDLATIEQLVSAGTSREEAIAQFDNDAAFDTWYTTLKTSLEAIL